MAKYLLKTTGGFAGTKKESDISDWFSDDDYKIFTGEKGDNSGLFDDLLSAAIEQQGFDWGIEKIED